MDRAYTETTRLLCAAAYQDWAFRDTVIAHLSKLGCNAAQTCVGVDLVPVVKHCWAARRQKDTRDLALGLTTLAAVVLAWVAGSPAIQIPLLLMAYAIAVVITGWDRWVTDFRIVAGQLSESKFNPDAAPEPVGTEARESVELAKQIGSSNVCVYSGFLPFNICGTPVGGWSFALEVEKPKEEFGRTDEIISFTVEELYGHIDSALGRLSIPGLTLTDHLFANGRDVKRDSRFLPDRFGRPSLSLPPEVIREFIGVSAEHIRHFKWIKVVGWSGELILSIILNFSRLGTKLYVEADYYLLAPVRDEYRRVDRMVREPGLRRTLAHLADVPVAAFVFAIASPFVVVAKPFRRLVRFLDRRAVRRRISNNPDYDYGSAISIRQWVSADGYHHYFQKVDKEKYVKVLERQLLDAIQEFLDSKNIDTSDLKDRQTTILNSGVIMSGGTIAAASVAVGEGSQARSTRGKRNSAKRATAISSSPH